MTDAVLLREKKVARSAARAPQAQVQAEVHLPERIEDYLPDDQWAIFKPALEAVRALGVPFAIGGGLATSFYSGMWRNSKDIDLYVLRQDRERVTAAVLATGLTDYFDQAPYDRAWIFRAARDGVIVDMMWALANGAGDISADWLTGGALARVRGETLRLLRPEDVFWTKVHVLQRDRCDWPDLLNLLYAAGPAFDWTRLFARMSGNERLLASMLSLFAWLAPGRALDLPEWLWARLQLTPPSGGPRRSNDRVRLLDTRDWFTSIDV